MTFNEKRISLRKAKGLSQDELGQRLGGSVKRYPSGSWHKVTHTFRGWL